ncbi:MAG: hypothetical protein V1743_00415 [Nanoarchaeota archaeon]
MIHIPKVHTKAKRLLRLHTHFKHKSYFQASKRKRGAKTFKTREGAKAWAEKQGLQEGKYSIIPAKKGKKFQVHMLR